MHVKKNDIVVVIAGRDKGKTGKILRVLPADGRVVVERINLVKRHQKPNQKDRTGGIIEKEAPISCSNVQPLDTKTNKPTRVRYGQGKDGKKIRLAARSGAVIEA